MFNKEQIKEKTKKGLYSTTHFVFPRDILLEIDEAAGKRKRSAFILDAAKEKLAREKLGMILRDAAGAWTDKNHPDLKTGKDIKRYVRRMRQASDNRLKDVV